MAIKISQMTAKGSALAALDLLEIAMASGGSYLPRYATGQNIFDGAFNSKTTDNLTQGSTNKYYADALVAAYLSNATALDAIVHSVNGISLATNTGFTLTGGSSSKTLTVRNSFGVDAEGNTIGFNIVNGSLFISDPANRYCVGMPFNSSDAVFTGPSQGILWINESTNTINARVKRADGSLVDASFLSGITLPLSTTQGGTGLTSYALGDIIYSSAANTLSKLAGNTTTAKQFLTQTGTGTVSASPAWAAITNADIPSALTGKTYNGCSITAASGFSINGGAGGLNLIIDSDFDVEPVGSGFSIRSGTGSKTITVGSSFGTDSSGNTLGFNIVGGSLFISDGNNRFVQGMPSSADDALLSGNSRCEFWIDETKNIINARVKKSGGGLVDAGFSLVTDTDPFFNSVKIGSGNNYLGFTYDATNKRGQIDAYKDVSGSPVPAPIYLGYNGGSGGTGQRSNTVIWLDPDTVSNIASKMFGSSVSFAIDETLNAFQIVVKYSNGTTVKSANIAIA